MRREDRRIPIVDLAVGVEIPIRPNGAGLLPPVGPQNRGVLVVDDGVEVGVAHQPIFIGPDVHRAVEDTVLAVQVGHERIAVGVNGQGVAPPVDRRAVGPKMQIARILGRRIADEPRIDADQIEPAPGGQRAVDVRIGRSRVQGDDRIGDGQP